MGNNHDVFGSVHLRMVSGDIPEFLRKTNEKGIIFRHLTWEDPLTITAVIDRKQYRRLTVCAKRSSASVKILDGIGAFGNLRSLFSRPLLLIACILICVLTVYLPNRILLIEVIGNEHLSADRILEQASACGITFGTSARAIRSENVKNALLRSLPELQWAGINTYGTRAVISVKERPPETEGFRSNGVASMVATCDGIVKSCTATKGTLLCKPGQAVEKGQVLISGYTDCGLLIRATHAEGEVYADTEREITALLPLHYRHRGELVSQETKVSVIIGKKRINLFKDSGILGAGCVKIYREYPLKLPGGFVLPITLVLEQYFTYSEQQVTTDPGLYQAVASEYAKSYLLTNMVSGRINDSTVMSEYTDNLLVFRGVFSCTEMIGRVRNEGITNLYGKID